MSRNIRSIRCTIDLSKLVITFENGKESWCDMPEWVKEELSDGTWDQWARNFIKNYLPALKERRNNIAGGGRNRSR